MFEWCRWYIVWFVKKKLGYKKILVINICIFIFFKVILLMIKIFFKKVYDILKICSLKVENVNKYV